jgi:hypothetical protein
MVTTFSAGQHRLGVALLVTNEGGTAMNVSDKGRLPSVTNFVRIQIYPYI